MPDSCEIVSRKSPDWLPADWTEEVKLRNGRNVKSYINPLTGHRFYSKPKVLEYLGIVKSDSGTPHKKTMGNNSDSNLPVKTNETPESLPHGSVTESIPQENGSQSGKDYKLIADEVADSGKMVAEKSPDWLPAGWTMDVKVRNGRCIKSYIDPLSGHRFYSKPKVLEYLGIVKSNSCTFQKETMGNNSVSNLPVKINEILESLPNERVTELKAGEKGSKSGKDYKLVVSEMSDSGKMVAGKLPDWLPAGWTEEVKSRNGRNLKCYVDSLTGRKFYSKPKVLEYLRTVKIDGCTSEKKKGNDFDINLPVKINDTPESLPHDQITALETRENGSQVGKNFKLPVKTIDTPESLPHGWITEVIPRKIGSSSGKSYKRYTDPMTGRRFFSKQKVFEYLRTVKQNSVSSQQKKTVLGSVTIPIMDEIGGETTPPQLKGTQNVTAHNHMGFTSTLKATSSREQLGRKIGIEELSPEGLPPGWIKEFKIQKKANGTRKIAYYTDPVSGYVFSSQKDVLRYLEARDISKCVIKPKKRDEMGFAKEWSLPNKDKIGSKTPLPLLEGSNRVNTRKIASCSSEEKTTSSSKQSGSEVVIKRVRAEGLPSGWIKEIKIEKYYTDPTSGYVFRSQKDALRYLETGDISTCDIEPRSRDELGLNEGSPPKMDKTGGETPLQRLEGSQNVNALKHSRSSSQQKEMSSSKQSGREILIERVKPEGLPPGWIKEIKIQKRGNGTRRDPYYTDPVSGYVFRSQKDVVRYLETGDITKCSIKPKSRDELGLNERNSVASPAVMQKLGRDTAKKQTSAGKKVSPKRRLETIDSDGSQKRRQTRASAGAIITTTPTVESPKEKHLIDNVIEKSTEAKKGNDSSRTPPPNTKGSKRKRSTDLSFPSTESLQEKNLQKKGMKKNSNRKIHSPSSKPKKKETLRSPSSKPKKKETLRLPSRSSKRLSGLKTETMLNLGSSEQALIAEADKSGKNEENPSPNALEDVTCNAPQQSETVPEVDKNKTNHALEGTEAPRNAETLNKSKEPSEDQAVSEEQPLYQFGESWTDPCLDFAFKTLTGAIPFEDNIPSQNLFQPQVDTTQVQTTDNCLSLLDFGAPGFHQVSTSPSEKNGLEAPTEPKSVTDLLTNPTVPPNENSSLPKCTESVSQQIDLEVNMNVQLEGTNGT